jgi:hypothetical protein
VNGANRAKLISKLVRKGLNKSEKWLPDSMLSDPIQ